MKAQNFDSPIGSEDIERTLLNWEHADSNREWYQEELTWMRRLARQAFALSRSWRIGDWFSLRQLQNGSPRRTRADYAQSVPWPLWKHPSFFIDAQNRPVGIVCHVYDGWEDTLRDAAALQLKAERLPWSWYRPGSSKAVLLTREGGINTERLANPQRHIE